MNSEIISYINFLKGLLVNFEQHKKETLIAKTLERNKELLINLEQSSILSYGLSVNEHTKNITNIFLENKYDVNVDLASFTALKNKRYKSANLILNSHFDINSKDKNGYSIIHIALGQINLKSSNKTISNVNKFLLNINLNDVLLDLFELQQHIEKAKQNLIIINKNFPQMTNNLLEDFLTFEKKFNIFFEKEKMNIAFPQKIKQKVIKI